jgi:hypothetical protein
MNNELTKSQKIAMLNDAFRKNLSLYMFTGQVVTTTAIAELPMNEKASIFKKVQNFNNFNDYTDFHCKHDFGLLDHNGEKILWKIDCCDNSLIFGSEDAFDPSLTKRILTVMFGYEY